MRPPARSNPFTADLWEAAAPVYRAILEHPFVSGLTDGTLSRDRFAFYVVQDALYLDDYARALTALAAKAPDGEALAMFAGHATEALAVERSLHAGFLDELGMHREQMEAAVPAPATRAYGDFLTATVLGRPFHEGLAAVLPCYWIYQRVGRELLPKGSPDPLYRRWIETYGGEAFDAVVRAVLALTDEVADGLTGGQKGSMRDLYVLGSRYEWIFWDAAYHLRRWPV